MTHLTLARINKEINRVARLEGRPNKGKVIDFVLEPTSRNGYLWVKAQGSIAINSYARVRDFVAQNLGVDDIYEGSTTQFEEAKRKTK